MSHSGSPGVTITHRALLDAECGAVRISELCEERGLSPESLAKGICARADSGQDWFVTLGGIDASTVRAMLGNPAKDRAPKVPTVRVRAAVARYFGMKSVDIWPPLSHRVGGRIAA